MTTITRKPKAKATSAKRDTPTASLAPLIITIRIDKEETIRQLAIEAGAICSEPAAIIPELVRVGLEAFRASGQIWALKGEDKMAAEKIAPFRR